RVNAHLVATGRRFAQIEAEGANHAYRRLGGKPRHRHRCSLPLRRPRRAIPADAYIPCVDLAAPCPATPSSPASTSPRRRPRAPIVSTSLPPSISLPSRGKVELGNRAASHFDGETVGGGADFPSRVLSSVHPRRPTEGHSFLGSRLLWIDRTNFKFAMEKKVERQYKVMKFRSIINFF
ncbi:unnamed protein product, partial [Urochloa humidicola]